MLLRIKCQGVVTDTRLNLNEQDNVHGPRGTQLHAGPNMEFVNNVIKL